MKRWPVILALAGTMVAGHVQPAEAINKEWSAALGFLGGVLVANNYDGHRSYSSREVVYQQPTVYRQTVVYERPVCPPPVIIRERPSGHYEYQERRSWVPGTWVYEEIGCNTYRKDWRPGYHKTVTVKVWIPGDYEVVADAYSE